MEMVQSLEIIQEAQLIDCKAKHKKLKKTEDNKVHSDSRYSCSSYKTCYSILYIQQLGPMVTLQRVSGSNLGRYTYCSENFSGFLSLQSGKFWDTISNYHTAVALYILSISVLPVHTVYSGPMTFPFDKS
jgi:hypothetical protein